MLRINKRIVGLFITIIFILYGTNNEIWERNFFLNEVLSLIGIFIFLFTYFRKKQFNEDKYIKRLLIFYIFINIWIAIMSVSKATNAYYFFRNSVIFYSAFSYYVGVYFFKEIEYWINRLSFILKSIIYPFILSGSYLILDRFSVSVFFPLIQNKTNKLTIWYIILLNIIYSITFDSLTVILITILTIVLYLIKSFRSFKIILFFALCIVGYGIYYLTPFILLYQSGEGAKLLGDVRSVVDSNPILSADPNTTWRLVFWFKVIIDRFPECLMGIGFGTPLLDYVPGAMTEGSVGEHDDEYNIHVMGVHNTYITLFIRLGIPFLFFIIILFRNVLKFFYNNRNYLEEKSRIKFYLAFFTISIIGLFNLVLESPIYASVFWFLLGCVSHIKYLRTETKKYSIES